MESLAITNQDGGIIQFSPEQVLSQVKMIQDLMSQVMQNDLHYGVIPGTPKPTLYKAGAEKLNFTFRLAPKFKIEKSDLNDGHREYEIICELYHINSGQFFGAGVGSCSTMEVKYRYRESKRKCPACNLETIIKGKQEYGGGWVCFKKKGGCGVKFDDSDPVIIDQKIGRIENPDLADQYNTILKMAKKRALVDATITACAASDIFFQDLEDLNVKVENGKKPDSSPKKTTTKKTTKKPEPTGDAQEVVVKINANLLTLAKGELPKGTDKEIGAKVDELRMKYTGCKDTKELLALEYKTLCIRHGNVKKQVTNAEAATEPAAADVGDGEDGELPF